MRHVTSYAVISLISACFAGPAFSAASLPIVNIGAGAVSARAMFGDAPEVRRTIMDPVRPVHLAKGNVDPQSVSSAPNTQKPATVSPSATTTAAADVLAPMRPSDDLWAKNKNSSVEPPLRMPNVTEFAVLKGDFDLPEESLDQMLAKMRPSPKATVRTADKRMADAGYADDLFVRADPVQKNTASAPVMADAVPQKDMSGELASITESIKRLEAKLGTIQAAAPVQKMTAAPKVAYDIPATAPAAPRAKKRTVIQEPTPIVRAADLDMPTMTKRGDVTIERMVVSMDDDAPSYRVPAPNAADGVRNVAGADTEPTFDYKGDMPLSKLSPSQLKKAFQKTYLSENKYLSSYQIDDSFDVISSSVEMVGLDPVRDLSEKGGIRPLEVKIGFRNDDAALSRDNYNLLSEYASIVVANPKRAIQVSIPERATRSLDGRKLAARRLAIVEQVLRDTGVSEQRIIPVLAQRVDDAFVLRVVSSEQHETLTTGQRDMFGDPINTSTYKSMKW